MLHDEGTRWMHAVVDSSPTKVPPSRYQEGSGVRVPLQHSSAQSHGRSYGSSHGSQSRRTTLDELLRSLELPQALSH